MVLIQHSYISLWYSGIYVFLTWDVATPVATRGRDDLSVCLLRSSPACVCTAPSVLGLLLINLVHYLFSCAGLRGHQPLCADCRGGAYVGFSDIRLHTAAAAAGMFMSSLIPRPPHHQPTTFAFHNNLMMLQYRRWYYLCQCLFYTTRKKRNCLSVALRRQIRVKNT